MTLVKSDKVLNSDHLFSQAERYEENGDFEKAFECLLRAAHLNHEGGQVQLGNFYSWGRGISKSLSSAVYWYRRAYRNGSGSAAYNLALIKKEQGSLRGAVTWFEKALKLGDGEASLELAKIYLSKRGGRRMAIELLKRTQSMETHEISDDAKERSLALLTDLLKIEGQNNH